jgi:hypothetical protein
MYMCVCICVYMCVCVCVCVCVCGEESAGKELLRHRGTGQQKQDKK